MFGFFFFSFIYFSPCCLLFFLLFFFVLFFLFVCFLSFPNNAVEKAKELRRERNIPCLLLPTVTMDSVHWIELASSSEGLKCIKL